MGKRLVIDASIARSAGPEGATFPTSKHCRELLKTVMTANHRVVFTPDITEEWKKHQSAFARQWKTSMYAHRRIDEIAYETLIQLIVHKRLDKLRVMIARIAMSDKNRDIMLKDCHLLEGAAITDEIVLSLDDEVRALFAQACAKIGPIRAIIWANPDSHNSEILIWLNEGASVKKEWQLQHESVL
ncbi:MAG: hypothetical protein ACYDBJ_06285 [Aggregatilineales bacterium]